ncbi:UDP-N-acetylmuramoyl-L-alanine--D-glutamate ligase [Ponticaulis sp.]|uniref:UDP-N-acetylmuramoyl-L-alanine--D-glutamate ligase n=1 Tax=Ponticaulis sp. TaxID=2020902 RepID=UPI000B75B148|nr:UDP-N-acetylmuramoyl-L-alanine--D-glutamate ligase [Ponticaulis sp.]MAI88996.1 UDP-N-acetylmuramoyl-L-alanine--D-glutamate ligase [Ponticaulis sp.]OUY01680.1 MAG: UDP-N-acetylmuramoyl-L-alanine--D-glutamate ligase [Hyphomonadaceae bacterium TMED5]
MIPIHEFAGQYVAVFGLGRTGLAAVRALKAGGAKVHAWDDNKVARDRAIEQGFELVDINKRDWQQYSALVLSPGIPYRFPEPHRVVELARMVGVEVIGDMELFARAVNDLPEHSRPKIVGVTGTNGKSTTTSLIGHILKKAGKDVRVGGNIGVGVLDMAPLHANAVYVLELSSYQLDLMESLKCDVAVLLNITPDHLERHGGMQGYIDAKARIFNNQSEKDLAVIGMDTMSTQIMMAKMAARKEHLTVGISSQYALGRGVSVVRGRLFDSQSGRAMMVGDLNDVAALPGAHNHQNAAAAYAACRGLGIDPTIIMEAIESFPGLAHRQEVIGKIGDVTFVNDSKATNGQAALQALKSYPRVYWIGGGVAKSDGLADVRPYFGHIAKAYLIGEAQNQFARELGDEVAFSKCKTLDRAIAEALHDAQNSGEHDPIVLLSPACASFDQFKDFEARGEEFRQLVFSLKDETERFKATV